MNRQLKFQSVILNVSIFKDFIEIDSVISLTDLSSQVSFSIAELRQIIFTIYNKHSLSHLPLWFSPVQEDLLGTCFNSYIIRLVSNCENNSVVFNAEMKKL